MRYEIDIPDDLIAKTNTATLKWWCSENGYTLKPIPAEPEITNNKDGSVNWEPIITRSEFEEQQILLAKLQQQNAELSERISLLEKYNDLSGKEWRELVVEKPLPNFIPKDELDVFDFSTKLMREFLEKTGRYPTSEEIKELGEKGSVKVEHPPLPEPKLLTYEEWCDANLWKIQREGLSFDEMSEIGKVSRAVFYARYLCSMLGVRIDISQNKLTLHGIWSIRFQNYMGSERLQILSDLFVTS